MVAKGGAKVVFIYTVVEVLIANKAARHGV